MFNRSWAARACKIPILLAASCVALFGQGTGVIYGTITDASGAAVPGAQVEAVLVERATTRTGISATNGQYVFPAMPVGAYEVRVKAQGFESFRRESITLTANQNVRVDVVLTVGRATESVTVTAEVPLVDSRSAVMGTLIEGRRLTELPINGRNVVSLAALLPGAADIEDPQTFTGDRKGPTVSMSGMKANSNLFLFDGQTYSALFRNKGMQYPPPDALQEVKVLTSGFSAEYGQNAGGVFNIVTKAGTNQFHGTVWEFVRNSAFNARTFFAANNPQLAQNQFGGAAGGPLKRDRLFVFGSYEGLRVRQGALTPATATLTAAEKAGNFSGSKKITDPLAGAQFPGNLIPASRFDPVARTIVASPLFMPLPNRPDGTLVQMYAKPQDNDQGLIRVDYNLGARHVLSGRYNHNYATDITLAGQVATYELLFNWARSQSATLSDTYVITPSVVNELRVAYNRMSPAYVVQDGFSLNELGGSLPVVDDMRIPPFIKIKSRVSLGKASSVTAQIENNVYQIKDTVHWNRDRHAIKVGFEGYDNRYLNRSYSNVMGSFSFTGKITGNAAADFLIGKPQTVDVGMPPGEQSPVQKSFNWFVQDDWRVTSRLTLNLGLRYELGLPWVHPNNYWATYVPGRQSTVYPNAPLGQLFYGDAGIPRGMVQTDRNNFAPRIGFAWDPFGNGRTSVRGSFGVFYDSINANLMQNGVQPFKYQYSYQNPDSLSNPLKGQAPFPLTTNLANPQFFGRPSIVFPELGMRTPYVEQVNFAVQREITREAMIEAAYVGKFGHKLLYCNELNPAVAPAGADPDDYDVNAHRLTPAWGSIAMMGSMMSTSYHALQVQGRSRFGRFMSLQGSYTFSKAIDWSSSDSPEEPVYASNPFNLAAERGLADFDNRHSAALSWIIDLPVLRNRSRALRLVAGGWQWNGLISAHSGAPIMPNLEELDVALSGTIGQRPNVVGDWRVANPNASRWFNPEAFAVPDWGTYGNSGRNIIPGPGFVVMNAGLFKNFALPFREGAGIQFRSEYFNLLNRVNFSEVNAVLGDLFGKVGAARPARVLQFALKLQF